MLSTNGHLTRVHLASELAQAHDRYFNAKIDGGDVFYANISGLHPMSLVSQDNGDGTYRFDYMRSVAGTYFADISYNGVVFFDSSIKPLRIEPGSISLATQAVRAATQKTRGRIRIRNQIVPWPRRFSFSVTRTKSFRGREESRFQ